VNETPYAIVQQFTVTANLNQAGKVKVLIDSGSSGNFINESTVKRLKLPTFSKKEPPQSNACPRRGGGESRKANQVLYEDQRCERTKSQRDNNNGCSSIREA
jgi:hypothetical protein